jgi:large subunit ribosomal protein L18
MKIQTKEDRRDRIKLRLRKRIVGSAERPRLTVFRSSAHMYIQAVDDATGRTVASASTVEPAVKAKMAANVRGGNLAGAQLVGQTIAERLIAKGLKQVVFDRNGFLYHGRVRAVAESARKAGLEF